MRIKKITSQHRNDFRADMECEHCGHVQKLTGGYDDDFYHDRVIPNRCHCKACGKNRHGRSMEEQFEFQSAKAAPAPTIPA